MSVGVFCGFAATGCPLKVALFDKERLVHLFYGTPLFTYCR
jgi:hypothetical protein